MAPVTIMTDFERALQNALQETFPNAAIHGCFFHFGQVNLQDWKSTEFPD
jgi:hypothetical protein